MSPHTDVIGQKSQVLLPSRSMTNAAPKFVSTPAKSLSSSLPGFLRPQTASHAGRPPAVAMTPEQMVEKAKQEAHVVQRIAELQREGLWSEKRLPKVAEPARAKSHWDYLLEEMVWLAADFAQERKWKKNSARKVSFLYPNNLYLYILFLFLFSVYVYSSVVEWFLNIFKTRLQLLLEQKRRRNRGYEKSLLFLLKKFERFGQMLKRYISLIHFYCFLNAR